MITLPRTAAIEWLLREAAGVASPPVILGDLCNRLAREEIPISGAVLTIVSLDPLVSRRRIRWRRSDARVVEEIQFHGTSMQKGNSGLIEIKGTAMQSKWREWRFSHHQEVV
jgi:hypothetical protein